MSTTIAGKVLWYDQMDGIGIALDDSGNEYYIDSSVISGAIKSGSKITFEENLEVKNCRCGHKVRGVA